jgi:hypothetical protein
VKENPWKVAGIAAVTGVVFGLLLGQRWTVFDADDAGIK